VCRYRRKGLVVKETASEIRRRANNWLGSDVGVSYTITRIFDAGSDRGGPVSVFTARLAYGGTHRAPMVLVTVVASVNGFGQVTEHASWVGSTPKTYRRAVRRAIVLVTKMRLF
jgi:hypothetical protein